MYEVNRTKRSSQALVHFVTALASLFTDHGMSGLPLRAKYRQFTDARQFSHCVQLSLLELVIVKRRRGDFMHCSVFLLAAFLCVSFPCRRTTRDLCAHFFPESGNFSAAIAEVRDSNIFSAVVHETFVRLTLTLSASQVHLVKKRGMFLRINDCFSSHFAVVQPF